MKLIKYVTTWLLACVALTACDDNGGPDDIINTQKYDLQGKVEKGPFVSGSTLSIQPMDESLQVLGSMYNTTIVDNMGSFMVGSKEFDSPYAELMATGYFFNEVEGVLSNGTLTLRAIVDLSNSNTVNVNVLTHLKYARIKNLIATGKSFTEANNTAQRELFKAFALEQFANKEVSSFTITAGTDEAAALIAISSLLLVDRSEAELTEYLAKLCEDFGKNGVFSEEIKTEIESDKSKLAYRLTDIRENIIERYKDLGIDVKVKNILQYIDWDGDGKAGNETLKENELVVVDPATINVPNEGGSYTVTITSPIAVYLEPQMDEDIIIDAPTTDVIESIMDGLYEGYDSNISDHNKISCTVELAGKQLNIAVATLQSSIDKSKEIMLYDYVGNVVARVVINQAGNGQNIPSPTETPALGETGKAMVANIAMRLATGLCEYNMIEQYYNYNAGLDLVNKNVSPTASCIAKAWNELYAAGNAVLTLKNADEKSLNVYGDYCNILSAICYSTLVYGWGDVPYLREYNDIQQSVEWGGAPQTNATEIFAQLEDNLRYAIEVLPEKKNESTQDFNGLFFASKDVARVLLANICLYEGKYNEANDLLRQVVEAGFYEFDTTSGDICQIPASSSEVIYALLCDSGTRTRANITIEQPLEIPYLTLTDVMLSLAECNYMLGREHEAENYLSEVKRAKNITTEGGNILQEIKSVREQTLLHSGTYFAFLKRTGLAKEVCGVEDYRLLLPIPQQELETNMNLMQNPGY